jgi:hypothetical protein
MNDIYAIVWEAYSDRCVELGLTADELWEAGLIAVYQRGRFDA